MEPIMNNALKGLGLVLLGTLLMAGCGGTEPGPMDIPEDASSSSDGTVLEGPQQSLADPEPVTTEAACCYVKCTDQKWHGPLKGITYGNCTNYGKFWCPNHNMGYVGAKWDDC
jgi:hypothetical protein